MHIFGRYLPQLADRKETDKWETLQERQSLSQAQDVQS